MTSLKTSIKTITYLSDIGCLEIQGASLVTMNSRVKFRNLSDGEVRVRTLVYPAKMTDSNTQLSVMAPVGAALLGLRVGDSIHWELPGGVATHLEVLELEYQPEAAGDYLL
ncbi:regulator of nucleoside diphosphate kinase [Escherichia coli]|nr:regulator of nucleoside diphosphate kinase [Escherichia coli]STF27645.1 regulator of nucleoside diphosphate kinase [Escherichia coli]